jgi:hypothetical protein
MFRALATSVVLFCAVSVSARADPLSASDVVKDLTYFRDVWAAKERGYSPADRKRMVAFVDNEIAHAKPMERTQLALVFSEAQAMSGNAHTQRNYFGEENLFHTLPISFWLFPEGAIITRAHPDDRDLLGAKILRIGGVPIADAEQRMAKYIAGTAERHRYLTPSWLTRIEALEAVGLAQGGVAPFELQLSDGRVVNRTLGVAPTPDPAAATPPFRQSMLPGKGPNPWPHVLDGLKDLPLSDRAPDEFTSTPLEGGRVLYIRSTALSPYEGELTVQIKAYQIMDKAYKAAALLHDVIVDLRYNDGGSFQNITNFTTELAGMVGPTGHIYVITGRSTFSAAIIFTALLKDATHGRTTIIGEEPSDNPWFWSEGEFLQAPMSKLPLRATDGYHDWAHGCTDRAKCYWAAMLHSVAAGSLSPDKPVEMTYADYVAGRDPALETALGLIRAGSAKRRP